MDGRVRGDGAKKEQREGEKRERRRALRKGYEEKEGENSWDKKHSVRTCPQGSASSN